MNIVRTIVWVLLLALLLIFSVANWDQDVEVQIWDNLVWDTKLPAVVVVSFLIGLVPMWLLHRTTKWRLQRKIGALETSARTAAMAPAPTASPARSDVAHSNDAAPLRPLDTGGGHRPDPLETRSEMHPDPHPRADPGSESRTGARVDEFGKRNP